MQSDTRLTNCMNWICKCLQKKKKKKKGSQVYSPPAHISKYSVLTTSPVLPMEKQTNKNTVFQN